MDDIIRLWTARSYAHVTLVVTAYSCSIELGVHDNLPEFTTRAEGSGCVQECEERAMIWLRGTVSKVVI